MKRCACVRTDALDCAEDRYGATDEPCDCFCHQNENEVQMIYYVSYSQATPDEPSHGWYYSREDEDGETVIVGPFLSRNEARAAYDEAK